MQLFFYYIHKNKHKISFYFVFKAVVLIKWHMQYIKTDNEQATVCSWFARDASELQTFRGFMASFTTKAKHQVLV